MKKREFARWLREFETKRETAYHEAGHAAILWMFGNAHEIVLIKMKGTAGRCAQVRRRLYDLVKAILDGPRATPFDGLNPVARYVVRMHAQREMLYRLAGYATEGKLSPPDSMHWLETALEEGEWEWNEEEDLSKAVKLANAVCGDNGNAGRMLRRMASWTDEALSHPRLWGVVEALAEQLATVKGRMSGHKAYLIMKEAWGEGTLPYLEMGRRWRRRFCLRGVARAANRPRRRSPRVAGRGPGRNRGTKVDY